MSDFNPHINAVNDGDVFGICYCNGEFFRSCEGKIVDVRGKETLCLILSGGFAGTEYACLPEYQVSDFRELPDLNKLGFRDRDLEWFFSGMTDDKIKEIISPDKMNLYNAIIRILEIREAKAGERD